MALNHTVKRGDCIYSIAFENGFFPDTIWNHPQNKELKAKRKDPNVLFPGDVVFVPDKRIKEVSKATDQQHRFRVKNVPAKFRLQLLKDDQPRANEPYVLNVDGAIKEGTTMSDGVVEEYISPNAEHAKLTIGEGENAAVYRIRFGTLNPHDEVMGIQGRLNNLGFTRLPVNGKLDEETKRGIAAFQAANGLEVTGQPDKRTVSKLKSCEGGS